MRKTDGFHSRVYTDRPAYRYRAAYEEYKKKKRLEESEPGQINLFLEE